MTRAADSAPRPKRAYQRVEVAPCEGRHGVLLDGRPARTRTLSVLTAPTAELAAAIASEWREQGERVDLSRMPLTRLQMTAIDRAPIDRGAWCAVILDHFRTDLLCYRAAEPRALAERQKARWDPYLQWARAACGVDLRTGDGIAYVTQPEASLAAAARPLQTASDEALLAVKLTVETLGSGVLSFALWSGGFDADTVFADARLDEAFQIERWGEDEEACARTRNRRAELQTALTFLELSQIPGEAGGAMTGRVITGR